MAGRPVKGDRHFVGRNHELAVIEEAIGAARAGQGRLIVVRSEAGIGKTAMCAEAARRAELAGFAVGWGRCWSDGGAPPMTPWPDVLADLGGSDAARLLAGDGGTGDRDRFARFATVAELVAGRARRDLVLVVLDDAHAADTAALLLARYLVRALDRIPFVLVVTRRPSGDGGEPHALLDAIEREGTSLHLRAFDQHDTAAFLTANGLPADDGLALALTRLTGGNPLLLGQVVMHASPTDALAGAELVIGDALGVLSPEHRDIVALAAVLGLEVAAADLVALSGGEPADVHEALASAASAGLMDPAAGAWVFTHDLVRRAALRVLTPMETLDAHARAIGLHRCDDRPAAVARRAHHALVAASRSAADAEEAVARCREAARVLARGFEYERAAALLDSAVELAERLGPPDGHVDVLLEWADALQVCGRLADARVAHERGVAAADTAHDPLAAAHAALGLGGVWLDEHRGEAERTRVLRLQRAALDGLPADAAALRTRLTVRLAAEAVYDGAPVQPVLDALDAARRLGDERVLAEALSLTHHALLTPERLADRLPLAEELIGVASAAGDGIRALFGLLWKAVDLYLAGDVRGERTLSEVRERAEAIGCRSVTYIVGAIDVMRLIRDGRLDDAEAAAHECFELGVDVGDADATGYYGAHLLTIRWLQDRDRELLDVARDIVTSSTLVAQEFGFRAAGAAIAARAGHREEAEAGLRLLRAGGLAALPRSSTWLSGMVNIAEAAWTLGDAELAAEVAEQLEPFADRPAMPSLAVSCVGSVSRSLGLAALTAGDVEDAVQHLRRAVEHNLALGNRPLTAIARADLAVALVGRGRPGDRAAAGASLCLAVDAATDMGMAARAATWRTLAEELAADDADPAVLRREGDRWVIDVGSRRVVAPDLVGFSYLGSLLAHPGDEIPAVELCGGATVEGTGQDLVDRTTLDAYRRRVGELDDLLAGARQVGRRSRIARLEAERERLRAELANVLALSGRSRQFTDDGERARTAVRKAITRAIDAIAASDDDLGAELRATITTGRRCSYIPDDAHPRRWSVVVDA